MTCRNHLAADLGQDTEDHFGLERWSHLAKTTGKCAWQQTHGSVLRSAHGKEDAYSVDYARMVPLIVVALGEIKRELEQLKNDR